MSVLTEETLRSTLPEAPPPPPAPWSPARRIAFRFVFAYLFLYIFPFPIGAIPGTDRLASAYGKLWEWLVPWFGANVLHLAAPIQVVQNGSGDKTFDFVEVLLSLVLAIIATGVWSLLSRRRQYNTLEAWLRVYVRYVLAYIMLSYGMSKVFKSQFPLPTPFRLAQPYGDSSPMGLLWTFMGYSTPYTIFAGASEVLGGVLLFFRRTTTLGALVLVAVIGNIVMLNFCYDVPVKLYSTHLWLMSVYLLVPDAARLANFLVLNRPTPPAVLGYLRVPSRVRRAVPIVKWVLVGLLLFVTVKSGYQSWRTWGDGSKKDSKDSMNAAYHVEEFARNGKALPALVGDSLRWRRVSIMTNFGRFSVRAMNDSTARYKLEHDPKRKTLTIWPDTSTTKWTLAYSRPDSTRLVLNGVLLGDSLSVRMRKIDGSDFLLVRRGFHWVNEVPYNR